MSNADIFVEMIRLAEQYGEVITGHMYENDYITMDSDGLITLTQTGLDIAQSMFNRHTVLTQMQGDMERRLNTLETHNNTLRQTVEGFGTMLNELYKTK